MRRIVARALLATALLVSCFAFSARSAPRPPQSKNSPIDLVQIQLIVPNKITIGKPFRVLDEVENQGTGMAMPTTTGFYLSLDDVLDEQRDVVVGGRRVPRLGSSQSHSTVTPVTLKPETVQPGVYYFIAVADAKHELEERYVDNNIRTVRVTVLAADQKDGQKK